MPGQKRAVVAEHVGKKFGSTRVLDDVSMTVLAGQVVAIVGPSGAGKSTFLRCINKLESVDEGRIWVDGELVGYRESNGVLYELSERHVAQRRAKCGMVFQSFNLFQHLSALDNVALALRSVRRVPKTEARDRAVQALTDLGLEKCVHQYPHELSGGQQQRVAIARALVMDPAVLLLDEPTSALDPELVGEVLEAIRSLAAGGRTMILVTHEIAFARDIADVIVVMDMGRVVEFGAARELLAHPQEARTVTFLSRYYTQTQHGGEASRIG